MALFDIVKKGTPASPGVEQCEWQIARIEQDRQECFLDIGRLYARKNTAADAAGTPYEEKLLELDRLEERRGLLEKRKLALQNLRRCEKCGTILSLDSLFCNKCGEKLDEIGAEIMTDDPLCPNCKAPVTEGSTFCTYCGANLGEQTESAVAGETPAGNICPSCGTACSAGDAFCISCGTRLN